MVAWLKTRLVRLCAELLGEGISAVYSWHDLRHAFAQRNAGLRPLLRPAAGFETLLLLTPTRPAAPGNDACS